MARIPFSGLLDLSVACLIVVERHSALAKRTVSVGDVSSIVLDLVDHLDVEAEDLQDLDEFEDGVVEALGDLVDVKWVRRRRFGSVMRYAATDLAGDAVRWVRSKFAADPDRLRAFDALHTDITTLVVTQHGRAARR